MWHTISEAIGLLSGVAGLISALYGLYSWLNKRKVSKSSVDIRPVLTRIDQPNDLQIQKVQTLLRPPALALLVTGVLGSGIGLMGAVSGLFMPHIDPAHLSEPSDGTPLPEPDKASTRPAPKRDVTRPQINLNEMWKFIGAFYGVVGLMGVVSALGAIAMLNLKSHLLAVCGSVAAMGDLICCYVGIPVGIWCLWTLFKPEVKQAFDGIPSLHSPEVPMERPGSMRFRCSNCNKRLSIAKRKAGSVVHCPTCRAKIIVPQAPHAD